MNIKQVMVVSVVVLMLAATLGAAETGIGKITTITGKVSIDAFGKGVFIPAVKGDSIYQVTVIRTGAGGTATILLQAETREIPPGATVRVSDLVATASRKAGLGWFQAVGALFKSFSEAAVRKEEDLVLGGRAADASKTDASTLLWADEETEPGELLETAKSLASAKRYADALIQLGSIKADKDGSVMWSAMFWKGFCYFQIEDYVDAHEVLGAAYKSLRASKTPLGTAGEQRILLFQLGASAFLLGSDAESVSLFQAYLSQAAGDPYEPYAYMYLAKALSNSGEPRKAKSVAEEAVRKYKGTQFEKDFAALLGGL